MLLESNKEPSIVDIIFHYKSYLSGTRKDYPSETEFERLATFYCDNNETKKALQVLANAIDIYSFSPDLLLKKADVLISDEKIMEAMDCLNKTKSFGYLDWDLDVLYIECYVISGELIKAKKHIEQIIEQLHKSDKIEMLYEIADIYEENDHYEEVLNILYSVLETDSNEENALYKIFFWIDFTKQYEQSAIFFENLVQNNLFNYLIWFNYGAICYKLKLFEKAVECYEYSISLNDDFDFIYLGLADAYYKLKDYHKSSVAIEKSIELSPCKDSQILIKLASCYINLKEYSKARNILKKSIQLNKLDNIVYFQIANTYFQEKKFDFAEEYINRAIAIHSQKTIFYVKLSEIYFNTSQFELCLYSLGRAIRIKPNNTKYILKFLKYTLKTELFKDAFSIINNIVTTNKNKFLKNYLEALFLFYLKDNNFSKYTFNQTYLIEQNEKLFMLLSKIEKSFWGVINNNFNKKI